MVGERTSKARQRSVHGLWVAGFAHGPGDSCAPAGAELGARGEVVIEATIEVTQSGHGDRIIQRDFPPPGDVLRSPRGANISVTFWPLDADHQHRASQAL